MSDDDELEELERRMRAKLRAPKIGTSPSEARAFAKAEKDPLPKKILVERVKEWGDIG